MTKICLSNMPMPPSGNNQYINRVSMKGGKPRSWRAPSKELEDFQDQFKAWREENKVLVAKARAFCLNEILMKGLMVRADFYFCFPREKLWTKDDRPKILDTQNRVKGIQDELADALGIDDCHFWAGYSEKQETNKAPWVYAVLKPVHAKRVSDVKPEDL